MGYNKNQFVKSNDKKVLHKIKKHWVVISMAMLMAIGGQAAVSHVSAHADTTNNHQQTNNTQTVKEQLNSSLTKQSAANQNTTAKQTNAPSQIANQANELHQRILANATQNQSTAPKITQPQANVTQSAQGQNLKTENVGDVNVGDPNSQTPNGDKTNYDTNDANSTMNIYYLDTSKHNQIVGHKSTAGTATDPFDMSPFLNDLPSNYVLDQSQYNNSDGWTDGNHTQHQHANKPSDYPAIYEGGDNDLNIYVTPTPQASTQTIRIRYIDDTTGQQMNQEILQNSKGQTLSYSGDPANGSDGLKGYLQTPPVGGYAILNAGNFTGHDAMTSAEISKKNINTSALNMKSNDIYDAAGGINAGTNFTFGNNNDDGVQDINILISPISNPNAQRAQGSIVYKDATNGNSYVGSTPFNEAKGVSVSDNNAIGYFEKNYLPNGYKLDTNAGQLNPADSSKHTGYSATPGKWETNGSYVIYVEPDGTNPNVPKPKSHHSFINIQYQDANSSDPMYNQVLNTVGLSDASNAKFNISNYNGTNYTKLLPDNYVSDGAVSNSISGFPKSDSTSVITVPVKLAPNTNPRRPDYDPSDVNNYATYYIVYKDYDTGSDLSETSRYNKVSDVKVSDAKVGSIINYSPYIQNFPSGYRFMGYGTHNSRVASGETGNNSNVIYLQHINTSAQEINIKYLNTDGQQVGTGVIKGSDTSLNQNVDLTKSYHKGSSDEKAADYGGTLPNGLPDGYQTVNGESTNATATNNVQNATVIVTGKPVGRALTYSMPRYVTRDSSTGVKPYYNHHRISDWTFTIQHPVVGQQITFTPDEQKKSDGYMIEPTGYKANPGQAGMTVAVNANAADDGHTETGRTAFHTVSLTSKATKAPTEYDYTYDSTNKDNPNNPDATYPVQPIEVSFVDQKGNTVGYQTYDKDSGKETQHSGTMELKGSDGQVYNDISQQENMNSDVMETGSQYSAVPQGYHIENPHQQFAYTFTTNNNSKQPIQATVYVVGDSIGTGSSSGNGSSKGNAKAPAKAPAKPSNDPLNPNHSNPNNSSAPTNWPSDANEVRVVLHKHSIYDGDQTYSDLVRVEGQVGGTYTIAPNSGYEKGKTMIPSDYHANPSDQNANFMLNTDGSLSSVNNGANVSYAGGVPTVTFDYTKNTGSVNIEYDTGVLDKNNTQLDSPFAKHYSTTISGEVGSKFIPNLSDSGNGNYKGIGYLNDYGSNPYFLQISDKDTQGTTFNSSDVRSNSKTPLRTIHIAVAQVSPLKVVYHDVTGGNHDASTNTLNAYTRNDTGLSSDHSYGSDNSDTALINHYESLIPAGYAFQSNEEGFKDSSKQNQSSSKILDYGSGQLDIDLVKLPTPTPDTSLGHINVHYLLSNGTQVGEDQLAGNDKQAFNMTPYINSDVPYGYDYDSDSGVVSQFTAGVTNDINVKVSRNSEPLDAYTTVKIAYVTPSDNPVNIGKDKSDHDINYVEVTGKTGTAIDYSKYTSILPSGYVYFGKNGGDTFSKNHDGSEPTEKIEVEKPKSDYGTVHVNYLVSDGKGHDTPLSNDTILSKGKANSTFDMSTYENSVPDDTTSGKYYTFDRTTTGSKSNYIDYYNSGDQQLNIYLNEQKKHSPFGSVIIKYVDANNSSHVVAQRATGLTGDAFNIEPYEDQLPTGATFNSVSSGIPSFFPEDDDHTKVVTIKVNYNGNN